MKIVNGHVKMGTYLRSNEMACDHIHGPPHKWDCNCRLSISPSYREVHLSGTLTTWNWFRIPHGSPSYREYRWSFHLFVSEFCYHYDLFYQKLYCIMLLCHSTFFNSMTSHHYCGHCFNSLNSKDLWGHAH